MSNTETPPQGVENMKAIRRASKRVSRKAVSPVVATVILVLISVVAGVMLWLWVSGFTSAATAQQPALNERIKIDSVKVDETKSELNVYVRNVGSIPVTISSVYIVTYNGTYVEGSSQLSGTTTISPGDVSEITMSVTLGNYQPGVIYTVRVVTKNGVEASYNFVWP
jgi:flagellin-like protein